MMHILQIQHEANASNCLMPFTALRIFRRHMKCVRTAGEISTTRCKRYKTDGIAYVQVLYTHILPTWVVHALYKAEWSGLPVIW
jgi:hypothetical protein